MDKKENITESNTKHTQNKENHELPPLKNAINNQNILTNKT